VEKFVPLHQGIYIGSNVNIDIWVANFLIAFVKNRVILYSFFLAEDAALNVILRENVTIFYDPPVNDVAFLFVGQRILALESGF
jgi:hypothetical protein